MISFQLAHGIRQDAAWADDFRPKCNSSLLVKTYFSNATRFEVLGEVVTKEMHGPVHQIMCSSFIVILLPVRKSRTEHWRASCNLATKSEESEIWWLMCVKPCRHASRKAITPTCAAAWRTHGKNSCTANGRGWRNWMFRNLNRNRRQTDTNRDFSGGRNAVFTLFSCCRWQIKSMLLLSGVQVKRLDRSDLLAHFRKHGPRNTYLASTCNVYLPTGDKAKLVYILPKIHGQICHGEAWRHACSSPAVIGPGCGCSGGSLCACQNIHLRLAEAPIFETDVCISVGGWRWQGAGFA